MHILTLELTYHCMAISSHLETILLESSPSAMLIANRTITEDTSDSCGLVPLEEVFEEEA